MFNDWAFFNKVFRVSYIIAFSNYRQLSWLKSAILFELFWLLMYTNPDTDKMATRRTECLNMLILYTFKKNQK